MLGGWALVVHAIVVQIINHLSNQLPTGASTRKHPLLLFGLLQPIIASRPSLLPVLQLLQLLLLLLFPFLPRRLLLLRLLLLLLLKLLLLL